MVKDNSISARIITAFVIIIPILVVLLFAPRWVAIVLLFTISFLAFAEWLSLSNKAKTTKNLFILLFVFGIIGGGGFLAYKTYIDMQNKIVILSSQNETLKNASAEQEKIFSVHAKELTNDDIVKICSKDEKKKTILMCGNRNFHGFQKLILNQLIK